MSNQIKAEQLLKGHGPMLSSSLAKLFQQYDSSLSGEAARQRIARLAPPIRKLQGISFGRAKFLYLDEQFRTEKFKSKLKEALVTERTSAGRVLSALERVGGSCRVGHLPILAGTPILRRKGHVSTDSVVDFLIENRFLERNETERIFRLVSSEVDPSTGFLQEIRSFILDAFENWIIKTNFSSINAVETSLGDSPAVFGGFGWDLMAPCYLHPLVELVTNVKPKPGFFVADVLFNHDLSMVDEIGVEAVIHKAAAIRALRNNRKFLTAVLHLGLERPALELLRSKGIMTLQLDSFGDRGLQETIRELLKVFNNAVHVIRANPDQIWDLYKKIDKAHGTSLNLNGSLFTFLVAYLYAKTGGFIEVNRVVRSQTGEPAEIDVKILKDNEITAIECKGYIKGNTPTVQEIDFWVRERMPRINSWFKHSQLKAGIKSLNYKFIVSSDLPADIREYCESVREKHKKWPIEFLDGNSVLTRLRETGETGAVTIFNEHFGV